MVASENLSGAAILFLLKGILEVAVCQHTTK